MTVNDLIQNIPQWLRGDGTSAEVVISSRIRLARNLAAFPFLAKASDAERSEIFRLVVEAVQAARAPKDDGIIELSDADAIDREVLVERHLISRQHAEASGQRGVVVSADETISVMINEEDHIRTQGLRSGLELDAIWSDLDQFDDRLQDRLECAYDARLGFLTACPTNVGTGIRVSVMLHLPALKMTQEIERVARAANDMRLAVRGLYGEGTEAVGDFYQISNQTTLGKSERQIIDDLGRNLIPKIVEYERTARDALAAKRPHQLDDKVSRALGTLRSAGIISSEETLQHLSLLRLGINMGRLDIMDIHALNDALIRTQAAHLQKAQGRRLSSEKRGRLRAQLLHARFGGNGH